MNQPQPNIENITKMYEKLNYFDQYGGSFILFIFISILLFIGISYCFVKINAQPIIDDWVNQRCNPSILPFAGYITHPEGTTAFDYTNENFNYCTQNILSSISGNAVEPLSFVTNMLQKISDQIKNSIQAIRAMVDKVRTSAQSVSEEIMGRIMNIMIPLQQIIISFRDLVGKIQGALTGGLFTLLGSYYTLKSLMGAIAQFIITILIALAVIIAIFWILPFTWGAAMANTAIFIAIAIPMTIILVFMTNVLKVRTSLSIPSVKCFDKNTLITLNNGSQKIISEIKVGDILENNNEVTACIQVEQNGSIMYRIGEIIVSDSHKVFYNGKWISVFEHPNAIKDDNYIEPYLYCLNTSNKLILINDTIFSDWDEVDEDDIYELFQNPYVKLNSKTDIHKFMDGGFQANTNILLNNGKSKQIKDICVGDILEHGEKIYGIVEINGKNVSDQYQFILGEKLIIEGGPNLVISDSKFLDNTTLGFSSSNNRNTTKNKLNIKHDKLYHLLTDRKTFYIGNIQFYDYNAAIDLFLEKNNGKLLSMKYV
jgi:hypothetical protein